jgi:LPXTG-motif cell wall-anchored protein
MSSRPGSPQGTSDRISERLIPACRLGGGSGSLPITGTNVGLVAAAGLLLTGVGVVLFVGYWRRRPVKFVA